MRILLTGSTGFVGERIFDAYKEDIIAAPSLRGLKEEDIRKIVLQSEADVIIHTAAISGIPECEADPDASYQANVRIPVFLARAAKGADNAKLICFSSDQVYSGSEKPGPYKEEDASPSNVYSAHKLEMENRVLDICPDSVMLRAEWMYDHSAKKTTFYNIVRKASEKLCFSSLQYRGLTWRKEVSDAMNKAALLPGGAYNFGSETTLSMFELTREFASLFDKSSLVLDDRVRKHNLWMDCSKAKAAGIYFSPALEGLKRCALEAGDLAIKDAQDIMQQF